MQAYSVTSHVTPRYMPSKTPGAVRRKLKFVGISVAILEIDLKIQFNFQGHSLLGNYMHSTVLPDKWNIFKLLFTLKSPDHSAHQTHN